MKRLADDLRNVLNWEARRMGAISAATLRDVIKALDGMTPISGVDELALYAETAKEMRGLDGLI